MIGLKSKSNDRIDVAYLGCEKAGKRGRGSRNKIPFVAALKAQDSKPIKIHLRRVASFRKACIKRYSNHCLTSGSIVYSDGLRTSMPLMPVT